MDKLNIPQGSRVYLDSSILIYTVEVDLKFWKILEVLYNLKTPDAIHAATSIDLNCNRFLTNDKGFNNIPRLPTLILSQIGID